MVQLTSRFLHLFLVLIAIGVLDASFQVSAAPVINNARATKARVGIVIDKGVDEKRSSKSAFRGYEVNQSTRTIPLKRVDQTSQRGNPLMLLQHHINRANVKLASMKRSAIPSKEEQQLALERRKRSIIEQGDAALDRREYLSHLTSSTDRFAPNHGRIGVVITDDTSNRKRLLGGLLGGLVGGGGSAPQQQPMQISSSMAASTSPSSSSSSSAPPLSTAAAATVDKTAKSKTKTSSAALSSSSSSVPASGANAKGFTQAALNAANSDTVEKAEPVTAVESLGLDIEANDVGYIATVQIGSNNTNFRMLIDSGSADTWVPSSVCTGCGSTHQSLGHKVSTSYEKIGQSFSITYGTGSVSGHLGEDTFTIAGMKLTNHTIALTDKESTDFSDNSVPFDGLMGLAQEILSNSHQPTPIEALYSAKLVPAPVMGYRLARASDNDNDGEVTFGGVDATKYSGNLIEIPNVSTQGFWEIPIQGISFNGKVISALSSKRTAILDTGTTLIVAPKKDAELVHAQIQGSKSDGNGGYTIPCNTTKQLSFQFGGQDWPLNSQDMIFLPVNDSNLDGDCISAISAGNVGSANEWLLGASFVKNAYFATNTQANMVGLGKLK